VRKLHKPFTLTAKPGKNRMVKSNNK